MKKNAISSIIIILLLIITCKIQAQTTETLYYDKEWKGVATKTEASYYRVIKLNSSGAHQGEILDYYITGEIQARIDSAIIINKFDDSKSVFIGNSIRYYKSGQVEETLIRNSEGILIGDDITYYESGRLRSKASFTAKGEMVGSYFLYYENGKVSQELPSRNGKINGIGIYYNEKGIKTAEVQFLDGKPQNDWYLAFDEKGNSAKYGVKTNEPYIENTNSDPINSDKAPIKLQPKELKTYYRDGMTFNYYVFNGISVTMSLSLDKKYGKYYAVFIAIENLTGKAFNFNPDDIEAVYEMYGRSMKADVLSYNDYMKKVTNRQAWAAALVAFGEAGAANQAGYSSSSTTSSTTSNSTSYGRASGYYGNNYGSISGSSSTYGTSLTNSNTSSYNGAANYMAQQNAQSNVRNFQNQQFQIRSELSEGYLKLNTIDNEQRIIGMVNIVYENIKTLRIIIPVNGERYEFSYEK